MEKLSSLIRKASCGHRSTLQQSVTVPKKSDTINKNEKFLELVRHTLLCGLQCLQSFFVHGCSFVASFFIESFFVAYFIASFFVESIFICLCFIPFVCFYIFLAELKQLWQEGFNKLIKDLLKLNVGSDVKKDKFSSLIFLAAPPEVSMKDILLPVKHLSLDKHFAFVKNTFNTLRGKICQ